MQYHHDTSRVAHWLTADVAGLTELAGQLHRLARPHLYEALGQPALIQTVREFPIGVPLGELARSVADDALRRALRSPAPDAKALAARVGGLSAPGWQFARNLALVDLAEDAARELHAVRQAGRPAAQWHG